ncbi:MAG: GDSL-type esterase/lipase family protein [Treponema sp.]|jgi:lysophospholipase L1-like esterase|nr:GDSL-type esterase/lipase family protein [Treponema sp.]
MKRWLKPLIVTVGIILVCLITLGWFFKNMRGVQAHFTALPFEILGYPQDEVLLIGSSSMQFWRTSTFDLGPLHTYNVGIAGTVVEEWKKHLPRLVLPFNPRAIVMFVGTNDMHGGEGSKSGEAVAAELEEFFDILNRELPGVPLYFISVTHTLARQTVWADMDRCNSLVARMAEERELLHFIDLSGVLRGPDGKPLPDIFVNDGLHLNTKGYALWTSVVRPILLDELSVDREAL